MFLLTDRDVKIVGWLPGEIEVMKLVKKGLARQAARIGNVGLYDESEIIGHLNVESEPETAVLIFVKSIVGGPGNLLPLRDKLPVISPVKRDFFDKSLSFVERPRIEQITKTIRLDRHFVVEHDFSPIPGVSQSQGKSETGDEGAAKPRRDGHVQSRVRSDSINTEKSDNSETE